MTTLNLRRDAKRDRSPGSNEFIRFLQIYTDEFLERNRAAF
jgi:hypothetical protein